ncbi:MAG: hypothetical protein JXA20_10020 [Spirochaetes bacterium]|nr:hypothetical protein [Spirochaetota bacterium]
MKDVDTKSGRSRPYKFAVILLLLSSTFFFKQCQGCVRYDASHRLDPPRQVMYTFSSGFPLPCYDLNIVLLQDMTYHYAVSFPYKTALSIAADLLFVIIAFAAVRLYFDRRIGSINILFNCILIALVLFNASVLIVYFPDFLKSGLFYLFLVPADLINRFLRLFIANPGDFAVASRIYLVIVSLLFYTIALLIKRLFRRRRTARRG